MAYSIIRVFPIGTRAQNEAGVIGPNGRLGVVPEGRMFHVAGCVTGGGQVTAVRESRPGPVPRGDVHAGHDRGQRWRLHGAAHGNRGRDRPLLPVSGRAAR